MKCRRIVIMIILLAISGRAVMALELVVNGDFETTGPGQGIPGWVSGTSDPVYCPLTHTAVQHDATPGIVVVMPGNSGGGYNSSWIEQQINIPRDVISANLTFYYQWYTKNPIEWVYMDAYLGTIQLCEKQGGLLQTPTPGWDSSVNNLNLSGYGGVPLTLRISAYDDGVPDPNYVIVDDVSLDVVIATQTSSPTISPTPTITPTCTISPTITHTPTITPTYTITPTITLTLTITPWQVAFGDAIAYPNPAKGDRVIFMYSLTAAADVSIEIYNTLGYKVAHLEDRNQAGLMNQKTTWNISSVAPGVYLYQVVAKTRDNQIQKTKMQRVVIVK